MSECGDDDDAVYELRGVVFDNPGPRHQTMKEAIADALASERKDPPA
jgi:hypothetical protein